MGPTDTLLQSPAQPYTRRLLAALVGGAESTADLSTTPDP
jgi:ABC-type dipeptide/oligopeptide/nickel transport system ATPase component